MSPWLKYFISPVAVRKCQKRVCNLFVHHNNLEKRSQLHTGVNKIRLRSRKHHWSALIITLLICALISVFSSFAKRSSCLQKDKVKWAVCSNVIGVVERSHYSDTNWEEGKKNTLPHWHLQSWSSSIYDPFESLVTGLSISSCLRPPRPSSSACQIISLSHFFPPSSRPFPYVFSPFLTFSLFQIAHLRGFLQFQNLNPDNIVPSSPTSGSPSSYLSFTSGKDLEGLNLLLLSIPGHRLRVQDAGNHRVLFYLQGETKRKE